jgi:hypothetical protein
VSKKKWLLCFVQVDENKLSEDMPHGAELGSIPEAVRDAINEVAPSGSLELDSVFLLTDKQKGGLAPIVEHQSLPYHKYAVETRGEVCQEIGCQNHHFSFTIKTNDNDYRH